MSLSKEQLTEYNYRRDSFSDRICDDLCQFILQYLSLEDRVKQECVSKQFQRTAFLSYKQWIIKFNDKDYLKKLENILKRFPDITDIKSRLIPKALNRETETRFRVVCIRAVHLINLYCNDLTHFDCNFSTIIIDHDDQQICYKFMEKFGPQLISANLKWCPFEKGIRSLGGVSDMERLAINYPILGLSEVHFNRLKSLEVMFREEDHLKMLDAFIDRNGKGIKQLTINCLLMPDEELFKQLLNIISKLTNLVDLCLNSWYKHGLNDISFVNEVKQIALNCKQLKAIQCNYLIDPTVDTTDEGLFAPLRQFKRLERLELQFYNNSGSHEEMATSFKLFSFKAFKEFEALSRLKIYVLSKSSAPHQMAETILTDIDINLPKLQSLKITGIKLNASEWTADILSRLSRLQTIGLNLTNESVIPEIRAKMFEKCKNIRHFNIQPIVTNA